MLWKYIYRSVAVSQFLQSLALYQYYSPPPPWPFQKPKLSKLYGPRHNQPIRQAERKPIREPFWLLVPCAYT
jgi:hypothetical protein